MADPHETLGLPAQASEHEVRQRYLELVRQFPPDRAPQKFAEIHAAYDALRDPVRRLHTQLFLSREIDSLDDVIATVRSRLRGIKIPVETLLSIAEYD